MLFCTKLTQNSVYRSPIAESVFQQEIKERGIEDKWFVDSAATCGYHVGSQPERRARKTLEKHGIQTDHLARVLDEADFKEFEWIFAMDEQNAKDIKNEAPEGSKAKIELLGEYDPEDTSFIRDPYYDSGSEGFEVCYTRCLRAVKGFLDKHDK